MINNIKYCLARSALWVLILTFPVSLSAEEKLLFTSVQGAYNQKIPESVLTAAYARLGVAFETSWLPAARGLKMVDSGIADGDISRVGEIAKYYPDFIRINVPLNYLEGMVYSKNKQLLIDGWDSLKPLKIGINRGIKFAEKGASGMDVEMVNSFSSLFQILDRDRVDVIIAPRIIGQYQLIKLGLKDITAIEPPVIRLKQYHYLNKRHKVLATRLETVLKEMEESGEIEAIRSVYMQELVDGIIRAEPE